MAWTESRKIRNPDVAALSRLLYAVQDVEITEAKRRWQQDRLWNMSQNITGMPGGPGTPTGLEEPMADIGELEETYARELKGYVEEVRRAEAILKGIRDSGLRTFVGMKYVIGLPDRQIQKRLKMGRRRFEEACREIENAESMAQVKLANKYEMLQND